ncbi:hypothetical protein PBI_SCTP2_218 [Salicola phage SCTP-2]|nr:hypothetical protein PBI_SCTP2_218 [Salicola phage SCTP-2]
MKVNDILKENSKDDSKDHLYQAIIDGYYFQNYLKPIYDRYLKNEKSSDSNSIETALHNENLMKELSKHYILHGMFDKEYSNKVLTFKYRKQPKDTLKFIHNYVNELSKEKLGEAVRSLLFLTKELSEATEYGSFYAFFPIDECEFYYNPNISDFTITFDAQNLFKFHEFYDEPIKKSDKTMPFRKQIMEYILENDDITLSKDSVEKVKKYIYSIYQDFGLDENYADYIARYVEKRIEYFRDKVINYIGFIKKTDSIASIPEEGEVMAKPNRFILLPTIGSEDDVFVPLGKYYFENYIKEQ